MNVQWNNSFGMKTKHLSKINKNNFPLKGFKIFAYQEKNHIISKEFMDIYINDKTCIGKNALEYIKNISLNFHFQFYSKIFAQCLQHGKEMTLKNF